MPQTFLQEYGKLLFDGATGTYYASMHPERIGPCELACLSHPQEVLSMHRAYLAAGAQAIKTNTFALGTPFPGGQEQAFAIIDAACALAVQAANASGAFVFADLGPLPTGTPSGAYLPLLDRFLQNGMRCFLFETLPHCEGIAEAAAHIKAARPDAFVLVSFASAPDGFTRSGLSAAGLLTHMDECPWIDAVGLNCVSGPLHLHKLLQTLPPLKKPLSVMPNAGYPANMGGRTVYASNPAYFAEQMAKIAAQAQILGGCCGTTPEYIRAIAQAVSSGIHVQCRVAKVSQAKAAEASAAHASNPLLALLSRRKAVVVEIDPPENADSMRFLNGARYLQALGADALTIADCPIARVRADSSMLSAKLHRELGMQVIPHLACRDRNLNATKALLLGLGIEGVQNLLVITGDPLPASADIKGVFEFNSVLLAGYIRELNESAGLGLTVCAALNVNVPNFSAELKKARRKQEAGVRIFLTQPVHTEQALKNLAAARAALSAHILGGLLPIVSHRNALFMQNEVSGISLPSALVDAYAGLDRAQAEALAERTCVETAQRMCNYVDGYYLMTPFGRVELIGRIMRQIR